jgi:tRNA A37 threonylcarbamoyladenosine dehydratase
MKNYQYLKIKQVNSRLIKEFVENKAGRYKSQIEREERIKSDYEKKVQAKIDEKEQLKEKLKQLEEKEFEYISKLKNTVLVKQQEFESFKSKKVNNVEIESSGRKPNTARVKCSSVPKNYR